MTKDQIESYYALRDLDESYRMRIITLGEALRTAFELGRTRRVAEKRITCCVECGYRLDDFAQSQGYWFCGQECYDDLVTRVAQSEFRDIIIAGRQVPFVQVGMIVHPDDCLNCERDGNPLWCSALVCDIHDDDETARFGMMATLLFRNGERREEPCNELRRRWRLARDFDQSRVYTGRWGATPRGSVWPVAEVSKEA